MGAGLRALAFCHEIEHLDGHLFVEHIDHFLTDEELKEYPIPAAERKPGSIWHLLTALRDCELKNDALLYSLYEYIGDPHRRGIL